MGRVARAIALFCVFVAVLVGFVGKAQLNGWEDYFRFYTNWSWNVYLVFYLGLFLGCIFEALWQATIRVLYLPVLNLAFFVWILLQIVVLSDPGLLDEVADMPMRTFEIGNEFYHPLPLILVLVVSTIEYEHIKAIFHNAWYRSVAPGWLHALYFVWCVYFPVILGFIYAIVNNPIEVYGITAFGLPAALAISLLLSTAIGVVTFMLYSPYVSNKPL